MNKRLIFSIIFIFTLMFLSANIAFSANIRTVTPASQQEFKLRQEIIKFIPYEQLSKLLETNKKLVYMSYQELKKLIKEKSTPQKPAPVDYVIKDLELKGIIKDNYVAFDGNYEIELINKTWAKIPLLSTNTGLKYASLNEKQAPVIAANSFFSIILDKVGEHNLKLKFDVKNKKFGNNRIASFSVPGLPVTKLEIKYPLNMPDINIKNSSGLITKKFKDYKITYANMTGNGKIEIQWKAAPLKVKPIAKINKKPKIKAKPPKVISKTNTLISIDEGLLQGFSDFAFNIYHSPIEKLTFQIPDDIRILEVSSPQNIVDKGNHQITDPNKEAPGKILTVYLNSKIKDNVNIDISYEKTFENKKTKLNIPDIFPVGKEINKISGYLAVQTSGNSEIKPVKAKNISRVDVSDLPYRLKRLAEYPIIAAYSFIKDDFSLALEVAPHEDASVQVAVADVVKGDSRLSPNGILTSKASYTVRNMSEQFFKFNLPEGAEVLNAAINGIPQQVEKQDVKNKKETIYLINIKKHQNTKPFNLTVMYRQKLNMSFLSRLFNYQNLKLPHVLNMPVLTLSWNIYIPKNLKYWNFTNLNKGEKNYLNYMSYSRISRSLPQSYYEQESKIQAQIGSNFNDNDKVLSNKATGVLPPEFSMPPVKGLKQYKFSGYLPGAGFINVSILGIAAFIYYLSLFLLIYLVWRLLNKVYLTKIVEKNSTKDTLKNIVPLLAGIIVIAILIPCNAFWFFTIFTLISYIIYLLIKSRFLQKKNNGEDSSINENTK